MIAVDTNLRVYAHRPESPFHDRARQCLASLAEGAAAWAIPWHCLHRFFAVVTNRDFTRFPALKVRNPLVG